MNKLKQEVLKRDNFSCQKCGFKSTNPNDLEIHYINPLSSSGKDSPKNLTTLCPICHKYAPNSKKDFLSYINEKIDNSLLETFRKSEYSISKKTKTGMQKIFNSGTHISKAPKGYKIIDKQLVPTEDSEQIQKIFEEFLNTNISLTQLGKKNLMTTSGIKKLLTNTTYRGKVKFANQELNGQHKPIIDKHLFEQVQEKLKQICLK